MTGSSPRKWLVLVTVSLGLFMALLDATIVNIAVPAIMADLGTSVAGISWVLNAYNLGLLVLILAMGRFSDRLGQKRVFLFGLIMFTGFSLACGLAPSIGWLIAFRVGQSIGAAALIPVSLAILLGVFPRAQHGLATGIWGGIGAVAAAMGPTIGGALTQYASWSWIFFVNIPIGVAAVVLVARFVPEHRRATSGGLDPVGIGLSAAGFFALTLALIQGNEWGWTSTAIIALLGAGAALVVAWVVWELRTPSPLLDLRLFRDRTFAGANGGMLAMGMAMMGSMFLLIIFMVNVMGYSEIEAAIAVTPMPALGALLAPMVGKLLDHVSPRVPAALGMLAMAAGLLLLRQLDAGATLWDVMWRTLLLGVGLGLAMPSLAVAGMSAVPHRAGGAGSGAINWSRQMGFVLGVAVLVAVFTASMTDAMTGAVGEARTVVEAQVQLPAPQRAAVISGIEKNVAEMSAAPGDAGATADPLAGAPQAPAGSPAAEQQDELKLQLGSIFSTARADAFDLPFLVAAAVALVGVVPALLLGRRRKVTADEGDESDVWGSIADVA
jgi:EmrB/QacA subfamily drug resistance transporter